MDNEEKKPNMNINIPEKIQSPVFSNVAQISATDREVVFDFAFIQPNTNQGIMVSRVVITPEHAKAFRDVLTNTLKRYDEGKK